MNKNDKKEHRSKKGLINPNSIKEFKVYKETELMEFLIFKMPSTPKKTIKSILTHHQVAVGGVPVSQYNYKIYPEDIVTVSKNRIAKRDSSGLKVIYEDEDIIAIDKPSFLLTTATEKEKGRTAYRLVSSYMEEKHQGRIFVVHRLDEDTSGVLIFAKSHEVAKALQNNWQDIVTCRAYYAIVEGHMEKQEATLKNYLTQDSFQLIRVTDDKKKGKLAITDYKLVKENGPYSLLDVHLSSGRKNQIRVQLGHIGHYVIGDDKYGEPADPIKRLGLHAYQLTFTNPLSGKKYDLKSDMPASFKQLIFKQKQTSVKKEEKVIYRDSRAMTKIKKGRRKERRL